MNDLPKVTFLKTEYTGLEFEIMTLSSLFARQNRLPHRLDQPQRVEFFLVLFITQGSGTHIIDFEPHRFREGSILFISKGQTQSFDTDPNIDGYMLLFTEEFLSKNLIDADILSVYRLYNYHLQSPVIHLDHPEIDAFAHLFNEISTEYNIPNSFAKEEILRLLLKLMLLKAERIKRTLIPQEKSSEAFLNFSQFQNLLERNISETRNAKDYAGMMHISYKHLNEICKSVTGRTAKEVIDNFLVLEIKRHLAVTEISVKELAYKLGFDEPTNFVKYFKKQTQQTPTQFKKQLA